MKLAEKYKYTLCLVSVAAFWSTSYGLSKICQEYANAYTLLTLRFIGAFFITFPILYKSITPLKKKELSCAAKLGTLMFVACLTMVLGCQIYDGRRTRASSSACPSSSCRSSCGSSIRFG